VATTEEMMAQALQYHQAGNLVQAEQIYRQILQINPADANALHLLGLLAHQAGKPQTALALIGRAVALLPQVADFHANLGSVYLALGQLDEAVASYEEALRLRPEVPEGHYNLGLALAAQGKLGEALANYGQALQIKPDYKDALNNRGNVLKEMGRLAEAEASYREVMRLGPDNADGLNNLGLVLVEQGRLAEAEASYREALRLRPDNPGTHYNLGLALAKLGRLAEALAAYQEALRLRPDYAEAHNNLGLVLADQGRLNEAIACYRMAVAAKPNYAIAHNNLGVALQAQGRLEESVAAFQQALLFQPNGAQCHCNLGLAFLGQGMLEEALASCQQALRLDSNLAEAHVNMGSVFLRQAKLDDALACFQQALQVNSDFAKAHLAKGQTLLLTGDFEHGWPEYEWRWKTKGFNKWRVQTEGISPPPPWDGGPLTGRTILLKAEQGLGDTLQFIRYAPLVQERGARVVVWSYTLLQSLLRTCPGIDYVLAGNDPVPPVDVQAYLLSLPGLLGTTLGTIPADVPYLSADPVLVAQWQRELSTFPGLKIGIVWQGSPGNEEYRLSSVPLTEFAPLAGLEGVHLFSLQVGSGREQLPALAGLFPVTDLGARFDPASFGDAAAVVKNLDLVVTVDTAMAHLAGALGAPVWLALPFSPDWRWLLGREDSPWYPSMRLFRQARPGDWAEVFERIQGALQTRLGR